MQILNPWVNRELQNNPITEKQKQHDLKKEFKWKNKQSRRHYKDKVEKKLTEGQGHGMV